MLVWWGSQVDHSCCLRLPATLLLLSGPMWPLGRADTGFGSVSEGLPLGLFERSMQTNCPATTSSGRKHAAAKFNQLAVTQARAQGVFLVPVHPITNLDHQLTAKWGNLDELDGCVGPHPIRSIDCGQI